MSTTRTTDGRPELRLELCRLQRDSLDAAYLLRICCAQLALCGLSPQRIAQCLGVSERSVRRWATTASITGIEGLRSIGRKGRPGMLEPDRLAELRETLKLPPREVGYQDKSWSGPLLQRYLHQRFGLAMGCRQCQRLLRRLIEEN